MQNGSAGPQEGTQHRLAASKRGGAEREQRGKEQKLVSTLLYNVIINQSCPEFTVSWRRIKSHARIQAKKVYDPKGLSAWQK